MLSLLFSFNGRINRSKYWGASLALGFANFVANVTSSLMGASAGLAKTPAEKLSALAGQSAIMLPVFALLFWCGLAVQVKRFHDRGRSGWWSAVPFVAAAMLIASIVGSIASGAPIEKLFNDAAPYFYLLIFIGLAFFIDLGCLPGTEGPNKYGDPPGASGMSKPAPSGPAPESASALGMQAAMDRAIAQRDSMKTTLAKTSAPAQAPRPAATPVAAGAAPQGFGRRVAR